MIIEPTFCGSRFTTGRLLAIEDFFCDSWTSAHNGYKSAPRDLFTQGKNTSQTSSQSSSKLTSHTDSSKTTETTDNRGICYGCGKSGHLRRYCPSNPGNFQTGKGNNSENAQFCLDDKKPRQFMCFGSVNGIPVSTICRDTGCSSVIIVLPDVDLTCAKNIDVYDYLGLMDTFPVVRCYLRCACYNGYVYAIHAPIKFC